MKKSVPIFLVISVLLAACSHGWKDRRPDIILVSIDTLRADHLSCYGYHRLTSPRIDRFAKEAILFKRAFCQESWTLPSHMSLFTSLYPDTHGVSDEDSVLRKSIPTLTEVLKAHGYSTHAFTNGEWLNPKFGFGRGFDSYDHHRDFDETNQRNTLRTAKETNRKIFHFIQSKPASPFFLFVHYFDVHSDYGPIPYNSPPLFMNRFCADCKKHFPTDKRLNASVMMMNLNKKKIVLNERDKSDLSSLYDAGIAYTDHQFGALIDRLKREGLYKKSLIILTADHGEEFQEHGRLLHEQVYNEDIHIPLIIKFPSARRADQQVDRSAELIDLMPTLLAYLSIPSPEGVQGKNLLRSLDDASGNDFVFSKNKKGGEYSVLRGFKKAIYRPDKKNWEFYNLKKDPGETKNLVLSGAKGFGRLQDASFYWKKKNSLESKRYQGGAIQKLSPGARKSLKALGYLQ